MVKCDECGKKIPFFERRYNYTKENKILCIECDEIRQKEKVELEERKNLIEEKKLKELDTEFIEKERERLNQSKQNQAEKEAKEAELIKKEIENQEKLRSNNLEESKIEENHPALLELNQNLF